MDIQNKLDEIKNHFDNISDEEFERNLKKSGYGEIEPSGIPMLIDELKKIVPKENFRLQPNSSLIEIIKLEEKYQLNTDIFLRNCNTLYGTQVTEKDSELWLNEFETFKLFHGDEQSLNTIVNQ